MRWPEGSPGRRGSPCGCYGGTLVLNARVLGRGGQDCETGGTVALWTCASIYCHPSTPNAAEVQKVLFHLELDMLKPSELPSNRISRNLYDELPLPWTVDLPLLSFSESGFTSFEWDRDGILTDGMDFLNGDDVTIDDLEKSLNTASMVTRWREANPELAGTEHDCVKVTIGEIRRAMGISQGGSIRTVNGVAILLFKRNEV